MIGSNGAASHIPLVNVDGNKVLSDRIKTLADSIV